MGLSQISRVHQRDDLLEVGSQENLGLVDVSQHPLLLVGHLHTRVGNSLVHQALRVKVEFLQLVYLLQGDGSFGWRGQQNIVPDTDGSVVDTATEVDGVPLLHGIHQSHVC